MVEKGHTVLASVTTPKVNKWSISYFGLFVFINCINGRSHFRRNEVNENDEEQNL